MYWLGPAIWSFAFGLYARRAILFANLVPIVGGTGTKSLYSRSPKPYTLYPKPPSSQASFPSSEALVRNLFTLVALNPKP